MSKFSMVYVKQHPWMFGTIFLVFGVLLYLMLNRGASAASAGGTTVVTPGPSDAAIAANTALQEAQIGGQTQVALAQLSLAANNANNNSNENLAALALQGQLAQIQSDHDLGNAQIEASVAALGAQLASNLAITHDNNSFMLDYAKNAQDAATAQLLIGANLQATLGQQQLQGYMVSQELSFASHLSNKNLALSKIIIGNSGGAVTQADMPPPNTNAGGGGGFNIGGAIGAVVSPIGAIAGAVL